MDIEEKKLWKSNQKDGFALFFYILLTAYGIWLFASDGYSLTNAIYTFLVSGILILKIRTHLRLSGLERKVNADLAGRGYRFALSGATTVGYSEFGGFVFDMVLYSSNGEAGKYSVGLSKVDGITFYHFVMSESKVRYVAVVDGRNVQYFTN